MAFEQIVGIGFVAFVSFFFIFILMRRRGEIIRLIANPVPYFPRLKYGRPRRLRIRREILQTLNDAIMRVIDNLLLEQKTQSETKLVAKSDVPQSLAKKWLKIRENPENFTIYATYTKFPWRWKGQQGRMTYLLHVFSHDEMILPFGRHKEWRGKFLPTPIGIRSPTEAEWVKKRIEEFQREQKQKPQRQRKALSPTVIHGFQKEFKRRVKGQKWLLAIFHPTQTRTGEAQVYERIQGFESLLSIVAYAMQVVGPKLAKFEDLIFTVKGFKGYETELKRIIHELVADLGNVTVKYQAVRKSLKLKSKTEVLSPEVMPMPLTPETTKVAEPSKVKQALKGPFPWVQASVFIGFFFLVIGGLMYASDPNNWGLLFVGMFTFIFGVWMNWREKRTQRTLPFSEEAKEKITEAKESLTEEGA